VNAGQNDSQWMDPNETSQYIYHQLQKIQNDFPSTSAQSLTPHSRDIANTLNTLYQDLATKHQERESLKKPSF
jgi:hypothetical protein